MKLRAPCILVLILVVFIALAMMNSCSDAKASQPTDRMKEEPPTYNIISGDREYDDVTSLQKDSSGCISFRTQPCGCSKTSKFVKICGAYTIEEVRHE